MGLLGPEDEGVEVVVGHAVEDLAVDEVEHLLPHLPIDRAEAPLAVRLGGVGSPRGHRRRGAIERSRRLEPHLQELLGSLEVGVAVVIRHAIERISHRLISRSNLLKPFEGSAEE